MRSWSEVGKHVLQEYLLGDAFLWRLRGSADCALTFDDGPNLEHTRTMLAWHLGYRPDNYVLWAVELHKTRRLIGMINYHNRDLRGQRADLTWLLRPQYQGNGYMVEAGRALLRHLFDDMKVHKVEALIRKENKPSIALAKRLGFRLEGGPIRDRWFKDGRWHSVMLYGLVEGEER